ncbi:lipoprotein intramolecular transacylase Lit [Latilactobacillus curvatus]|uniref:lipoprotein intramolecular transacylase Lit n=1 Tax=Latilactobacillus curvatus TaxID=28038 RepID=UPI0036F195C7
MGGVVFGVSQQCDFNNVIVKLGTMQVALVVPPILGFIASMNFDRFFITFHELLFRNLNWQFDPITDPIILVLPEVYFGLCFALFFILLEGSFAWLLWRGKRAL